MPNTENITSLQGGPGYRVRHDDTGELVRDIHPVYVYSLKKDTPQEEIKEIAQDMVIEKTPDIIKYYNPEASAENKALNDYYNAYKKAYDNGSWWKPKFTAEQYRAMTPGEASELLTHPKDRAEWYRTRGSQGYGKLLAGTFGLPAATIVLPSLPSVAPAISHGLTVLTNPLAANTTLGFLTAAGIDAAATTYGLQRNSELINKWSNGQFNWSDIPEFALNTVPSWTASKVVYPTVSGVAQRGMNSLKTTWNAGKKVRPNYENWGGEFIDDVAVNSRQPFLPKQSKLSEAERLGIPKHIRTNKFKYPKAGLSTDANVYMVHKSNDIWPVEGDMIRFKMGRPYDVTIDFGRTAEDIAKYPSLYPEGTMPHKDEQVVTKYPFSMHFTHGAEVSPHISGDWDAAKITYLVPYKDIVAKNGAPHGVEPFDTFWTAGTTFGFDKKGVKALTFDKPTYLKLKSLGIDVEFSPEAIKSDFRKAWIKQKSIDAGMSVTDHHVTFTPPSEIHKMAKDAGDIIWMDKSTAETLPALGIDLAPKSHFGHWTYNLRHGKENIQNPTEMRNSVLNTLGYLANDDVGGTSLLSRYKFNSRSLDFPTLQSGVKWLGIRGLQLKPLYREKPYGTALKNRINNILSGKETIKYRKGGKL